MIDILRRLTSPDSARLSDPAIIPPRAYATDGIAIVWAPAPAGHLESTPPGFPATGENGVIAFVAAAEAAPDLGRATVADLIATLDRVAPVERDQTAPCDDCEGYGHLACAKHAEDGTGESDCDACRKAKCPECDGMGCVAVDRRARRVEALSAAPWFAPDGTGRCECLLDPTRALAVLEVLRDFGAGEVAIRRPVVVGPKVNRKAPKARPPAECPVAWVGDGLGGMLMPVIP